MNNRRVERTVFTIMMLLVFFSNYLYSKDPGLNKILQGTDSLALGKTIELVIKSHPTVKTAEEAINNADARIGLARTGYYPDVDLTANYSNLGPVVKLTFPSMGTFQLFPENNYSASVNYRQVVYDFGRTRQSIAFENENKAITEQSTELVKERLSLLVVNNFYTLAFLQAAIKIKDEQLTALNEHLNYVEKKKETGSATEYEVLSTKVRISSIESQKVDLYAALTAYQASLNSLTGNDQSMKPVVRNELSVNIPAIPVDSAYSYALQNRDEALINEKRASLAELRYDLVKLQMKPLISFQASGGAKNGYIPDLNKIQPNYVLGIGLRVPIFDGMRTKYNLMQAQSAITSITYESENTKRIISTEISEAEVYMLSAEKKISQYELQLSQAVKAYDLAEVSFKSGIITNLDLLDANTSVSESSLLLLKARIDYAASVYKLKVALGQRIY